MASRDKLTGDSRIENRRVLVRRELADGRCEISGGKQKEKVGDGREHGAL